MMKADRTWPRLICKWLCDCRPFRWSEWLIKPLNALTCVFVWLCDRKSMWINQLTFVMLSLHWLHCLFLLNSKFSNLHSFRLINFNSNLQFFLVISVFTVLASWDDWWTYDGISGNHICSVLISFFLLTAWLCSELNDDLKSFHPL